MAITEAASPGRGDDSAETGVDTGEPGGHLASSHSGQSTTFRNAFPAGL